MFTMFVRPNVERPDTPDTRLCSDIKPASTGSSPGKDSRPRFATVLKENRSEDAVGVRIAPFTLREGVLPANGMACGVGFTVRRRLRIQRKTRRRMITATPSATPPSIAPRLTEVVGLVLEAPTGEGVLKPTTGEAAPEPMIEMVKPEPTR